MKNSELSQRTVVFLIRDSQVLLGYKKTGLGKGNYLGIGGKIEAGETEVEATCREVHEEIGVENLTLTKVADLTFLFPEKPNWSQQVHAFLCNSWTGEPSESDEINPQWFNAEQLPLSQMWDDNQFWLPAVLSGHTVQGKFIFNSELKVKEFTLKNQTFA